MWSHLVNSGLQKEYYPTYILRKILSRRQKGEQQTIKKIYIWNLSANKILFEICVVTVAYVFDASLFTFLNDYENYIYV